MLTDAVTLTQELIRLDTTTGSVGERPALATIAQWFSNNPNYQVTMPLTDGQPQALVVVPTNPTSNNLLLLSGHVDVVSVGSDQWTNPPFSGEIIDNEIWGRGASDMKSGLAAQIAAMISAGPTAPVALAVSVEEEWGCAGTPQVLEALAETGITVDGMTATARQENTQLQVGAILVAEPTNGEIILGHKGPVWLNVTTGGKPAHGSTPHLGQSAIFAMTDLITRARTQMPVRTHWRLGQDTLNIGKISGGMMTNIVPDRCTISVDMRSVDPDSSVLINWWKNQPETMEVEIICDFPPVWTDADNPWVTALPGQPNPDPVGYGTEAATLGKALNWPPTVIWGPGQMRHMHVVDERVEISAVERAQREYGEAIQAWSALAN